MSITLSRTFSFSIYRKAKYKIDEIIESTTGVSPLQHVNKPGTFPNVSTVVCFGGAGMIAGGAMATVLSRCYQLSSMTSTDSCSTL
jgi:solute carrier family 25 (mitochondrial carnitine/acylcarnitine transporter), member 20/29